MARSVDELSVDEIRQRYLEGRELVSARVLNILQRDPRQGVRRLHAALKKRYARQREERLRLDAMRHFELVLWKSGVRDIAGVDEVGMGPLAGPVVAAAVVFPPETDIAGVDDSKRLEPAVREELALEIRAKATGIGLGICSVEEIDQVNIYHAGLLAMRRAVEALPCSPQHVLVDARTIPGVEAPQNTFNKGDGINFSIAAASIIAKTERDAMMETLDRQYPGYGFASHKGYSTPEHRDALVRLGPSAVHRMSFPVLHELQGEFSALFYTLKKQLDEARTRVALDAFESELRAQAAILAERECKKLRLLVARRWKVMG
ncbi:MAG TPA: ribonuclease HII [Casimicrobiaceae bacterium]|jgi:ribonuclease HII|nr:ribonuclease HII [Casimicrobiaceae bacterium]